MYTDWLSEIHCRFKYSCIVIGLGKNKIEYYEITPVTTIIYHVL